MRHRRKRSWPSAVLAASALSLALLSGGRAPAATPSHIDIEEFRYAPTPDPKLGHLAVMQPELIHTPGFDTLSAELSAFAAAIRDKTPYPVPHDEVLHGVEVFEAIVNSAKNGKPATLG